MKNNEKIEKLEKDIEKLENTINDKLILLEKKKTKDKLIEEINKLKLKKENKIDVMNIYKKKITSIVVKSKKNEQDIIIQNYTPIFKILQSESATIVNNIIHIADIHIKFDKQHNEYKEVFNRFYDDLRKKDKNTIICICGDILDTKYIYNTNVLLLAREFIKNISLIFPVFIIAGNHDIIETNNEKRCSISAILDLDLTKNIYYLINSGVYIYNNIVFGVSSLIDNYVLHIDETNKILQDNNYKLYSSNDHKLIVYSLHEKIYTDPYEGYNDNINITQELRELNNYVIANRFTLLYHDFTGRRNSLLSEYFDKEIGHSLNHVIYGMSTREDHGCYFDLSVMSSYFPFRIIREPGKRVFVELFNIYNYIINDKINLIQIESQYYDQHMSPMINCQIEQVITVVKTDLTNHIMSILRILHRLIVGDEQYENLHIDYSFNYFPKYCREEYLNLFHERQYKILYNKIIDFFSKDMDIIANLKKYDISGRDMLLFITHGDKPYEWYNNIKLFF